MEKNPPPYAPYPAQGPMNAPYPSGNQGFPQPQQPITGQPGGGAYPVPSQPGYYPGQQQPPQPGYYQPQQQPQAHTTVVMTGPAAQMPGQCPVCRAGMLNREFTCCGICCAIMFFPIGLLCLFCMKETRCSVCRANF